MDIAIIVLLNICAIKIQKDMVLWVLAFAVNAIVILKIYRRMRYVVYYDREKQASSVFSFLTLLMLIAFIHPQYLTPECDVVSKEFLECKLIKDGSVDFPSLQYLEIHEIMIPKVQKQMITKSSNYTFAILDIFSKIPKDEVEVSETVVTELKTLKIRYENELAELQQEAIWFQYQIKILIIFIVIYKIMWYWSDMKHLYHCVRKWGIAHSLNKKKRRIIR